VEEVQIKRRTAILKAFVKIAIESKRLNNFSALFSILAALNNAAVFRMKKTFAVCALRCAR
jgi:son of sevenless-like protein